MGNGRKVASSHPAPETLSKCVGIDVHAAGNVKQIVGSSTVLVGFNPLETELQVEAVKTVGDLADDVNVMTHTSALGTRFLGAVNFGNSSAIVHPENNATG
jgi:hypothetical protein